MAKKTEVNIHTIAGILSVMFILIEIIGFFYGLLMGIFQFGALDVILVFAFAYTAYKTLIKKKKLKLWEWVVFIILSIILILFFLYGYIIEIMGGY